MNMEEAHKLRYNSDHVLIRNFRGIAVYETKGPIRPRKDFVCDACEKNIRIGTDVKFMIKAYGDDGDWPEVRLARGHKVRGGAVSVHIITEGGNE